MMAQAKNLKLTTKLRSQTRPQATIGPEQSSTESVTRYQKPPVAVVGSKPLERIREKPTTNPLAQSHTGI